MIVVQIIYTYKSCVRCKFNLFNLLYGAFRLIKKQKNDSSTISNQTNYLIALSLRRNQFIIISTSMSIGTYLILNRLHDTEKISLFLFFGERERERSKQKIELQILPIFSFEELVFYFLTRGQIIIRKKASRERERMKFSSAYLFSRRLFFFLFFFFLFTLKFTVIVIRSSTREGTRNSKL